MTTLKRRTAVPLAAALLVLALPRLAAAQDELSAGDTSWMLTSSVLVLFMTIPGLSLFYAGLVRAKNVLSVMMQCFAITCMVTVLWTVYAYGLAFGDGGSLNGFIGFGKLFLSGVEGDTLSGTIPESGFQMFQLTFAVITPALMVGAFAERMKFTAFVIFIVAWVTIVYAPVAHWVWASDGWLGELGTLDFAGGTVVHINSGVAALAAALIFGRRLGFGERAMTAHNVPFVVLGAALLWFGWFGFNAGSALAADGTAVNAFVVTNVATAASVITWVAMSWIFGARPSVVGAASGAVAGLVAITPAAGFVGAMPAIIIGVGAGAICYGAIELLRKLRVDDALAVCGVHGIGGTWGALATGLFVGIGFGSLAEGVTRGQQILLQLIGIGATWAWAFIVTAIILLAIKYTIGLRVSEEEEAIGLDASQHGEITYIG